MSPIEQIKALAGLHDAELKSVSWSPSSGAVEIILGDLYANFRGFPEYKPRVTGVVEFEWVSDVVISSDATDRVTIYDWEIVEANGGFASNIRLSPGGHIKIQSRTVQLSERSADGMTPAWSGTTTPD